jgi:photosynthetic reaction center cytochrome c subunit
MTKIAGRENDPAGQVFKNVQIMKDVPAGQFLQAMDQTIGRSLSMGCTSCHVADQWDSDERNAKKTARIMLQIVNAINTEQLTKMPPNRNGQTPRIGCVTCHRGNGNPGTALVP